MDSTVRQKENEESRKFIKKLFKRCVIQQQFAISNSFTLLVRYLSNHIHLQHNETYNSMLFKSYFQKVFLLFFSYNICNQVLRRSRLL